MSVDVAAFAAHPDDAELGCGGLLARLAARGYRVAVVDLTAGEAASAGDPATRAREAAEAGEVLGLAERRNLGLPDGALHHGDRAQLAAVAAELRRLRPALALLPFPRCSHPDHVETGRLVERAAHLAGIPRWPEGAGGVSHRPRGLLYYESRIPLEPVFLADIGDELARKLRAIACHRSQFERSLGPDTAVNDPRFLAGLEARWRALGAGLGTAAAEPYLVGGPLPLEDPVALVRSVPGPAGRILGGGA